MKRKNPLNTAILIFARTPNADFRNKNISGGPELFEALNNQIQTTVKKSGLPYYFFDESQQVGNDFATRLTNAIELLFSKGYEGVISVGNDSPDLTPRHLKKAIAFLQNGIPVIGPATDGGVYLLGISEKCFYNLSFKALPWQTSRLKDELSGYLHQNADSVLVMDTLSDLDSQGDLKSLAYRYKNTPWQILRILRGLFKSTAPKENISLIRELQTYHSTLFNKGSPLFA